MNAETREKEKPVKLKFVKVSVLLPIIVGVVFGALLFALGYTQDAPGACAVGLALAFGLFMLAIRNAGIIKKGFLTPVLLFCYASGIAILNTVLILDDEFAEHPNMAYIGFWLCAAMFVAGVFLLHRRKKAQSGEDKT